MVFTFLKSYTSSSLDLNIFSSKRYTLIILLAAFLRTEENLTVFFFFTSMMEDKVKTDRLICRYAISRFPSSRGNISASRRIVIKYTNSFVRMVGSGGRGRGIFDSNTLFNY